MKSLIFILLISCSSLKIPYLKKDKKIALKLENYKRYNKVDYTDHLKSYDRVYLNSAKLKAVNLSYKNKQFLTTVVKKIENANELFFNETTEPEFHIIKSQIPFHFSLPGSKFFFSTGLLKKYIKNETMLYCLIAFELIRSEKNIYEKKLIIPTGDIDTQRILSILRLKIQDKVEVHKWAFYLLKRVGFESDSYLTWLQVKNRNSLDFAVQLGDVRSISREEALFKSFLIDNYLDQNTRSKYKGSSKQFYSFLRNL